MAPGPASHAPRRDPAATAEIVIHVPPNAFLRGTTGKPVFPVYCNDVFSHYV